jgi:RNA polymerase sigma-70 factor (ECF subfamily)
MSPAQLSVEAIYRDHGHLVRRRARAILGSEQEAEEVLQELIVSLLEKPRQFDGRSSVTTFLYSMTTHRCLNRIRDRNNRARLIDLHVKPMANGTTTLRADRLMLLRQTMARVPKDLAEVAAYYYIDEMTHEEIAAVVGCSRRQVGNLLQRFHVRAEKLRRSS